MPRQTKGGDPGGQKYMTSFESFVNRIAAAPKAEAEKPEAEREKRPRFKRKSKQPTK